MADSQHRVPVPADDRSRALVDFVHGLLLRPEAGSDLDGLLAGLAAAAGASAAGLALLPGDGPLEVGQRIAAGGPEAPRGRWPWDEQPDLPAQLRQATTALPVRTADGAGWLLTAPGQSGRAAWLLWLEAHGGRDWSAAEGTALALAAQVLLRQAEAGTAAPWARPFQRAAYQQRLEDAAVIVRRLAHDFGNVLTSILGFAELSLNQAPRGSALHEYLQEVYRGTLQAADWTGRLRLFSRRGAAPAAATPLAPVVTAEAGRLRAAWGPAVRLDVNVPADLPPVAMSPEGLRQTLLPLLENAREAIAGAGTVTLTAGLAELTPAGCLDLLGSPRPGPGVEVTVRDTGCGLGPEARRLPAEPFVSTKPGHHGLGLATVYGLLRAHGGGLALGPGPGGGAVARLHLPVAVTKSPTSVPTPCKEKRRAEPAR